MSILTRITTTGVANAIVNINKFRGALKKDAPEYIGEEAVKVLKDDRSRVPVRTGLMKDGIYYDVVGNDKIEIKTVAPYGGYVEDSPPYYRQSQNRNWPSRGAVRETLDNSDVIDKVVGRFKNG